MYDLDARTVVGRTKRSPSKHISGHSRHRMDGRETALHPSPRT